MKTIDANTIVQQTDTKKKLDIYDIIWNNFFF